MKTILLLLPLLFSGQINTGHYRTNGQPFIISTVFNEGTVGATVIGTKPATDVPNAPWAQSGAGALNAVFSVGGATFGPAGGSGVSAAMLDTGRSNETVTYTGVQFTGPNFDIGVRCNSVLSKGLLVDWTASTGALVMTDVGNVNTQIATGNVGSTTSGTITWTLNGQNVSVNFFGTVLSGTIPAGSPTLSLTFVVNSVTGSIGPGNTTTMKVAGLTVR
jgi:hypothetical protein